MSRCIKAYVDVVMMEEPSLFEMVSNFLTLIKIATYLEIHPIKLFQKTKEVEIKEIESYKN
jgi:hypothetical protein